jgi:hypothetical protein
MIDKNMAYTADHLNFKRRSVLEDIPDNYAERMMANSRKSSQPKKKKEVKIPQGFVVAPAYNKGGYMLIPKEDL